MKTEEQKKSHQQLSPREIEILEWTARGKTRRDVSKLLNISDETVKEYFENILRKLNAANKTHAVSIAAALGVITLCLEDIQNNFTYKSIPQMGDEGYEDSPQTGDAALKN